MTMSRMFPGVWLSTCGAKPCEPWVSEIAVLSEAQINQGLERCKKTARKFPPNLGEFLELCRPAKRENEAMYRISESHQITKQLSEEEKRKGSAWAKSMKAALGA
jgi:hypothetical protein